VSTIRPYIEITVAMLRTGILGYGGGPSVMPLFRYEAVNRYHWVTDEEFAEILAFGNSLPGPIATKMAAYLGYRRKGLVGAVLAVMAHVLPTCVGMVVLLSAFNALRDSKTVEGMIEAVNPVIAAMLAVMAYEFAEKARKGLGIWLAGAFCLVAFVLLVLLHLTAGLVVMLFLAYGAMHMKIVNRVRRFRGEDKGVSA
jgi:chromate transporter